jgi:hypothetical protein
MVGSFRWTAPSWTHLQSRLIGAAQFAKKIAVQLYQVREAGAIV